MHVIHLLNYHCKENLNFTLFTFPFSTYSVLFLCSVLQSSTLKMGFVQTFYIKHLMFVFIHIFHASISVFTWKAIVGCWSQ